MKTKTLSLIGILLLCCCWNAIGQQIESNTAVSQKNAVIISSTPELFPLASDLVSTYSKLHPEVVITVKETPVNSAELGNGDGLGFVSGNTANPNSPGWKMVVGRDIIVPIMNAANPLSAEIGKRGISTELFGQIIGNQENRNWAILGTGHNVPIQVFMADEESVKNAVNKFLLGAQVSDNNISFGTKEQVVAAIQKDVFAIGFCKISDILTPENMSISENINLLP